MSKWYRFKFTVITLNAETSVSLKHMKYIGHGKYENRWELIDRDEVYDYIRRHQKYANGSKESNNTDLNSEKLIRMYEWLDSYEFEDKVKYTTHYVIQRYTESDYQNMTISFYAKFKSENDAFMFKLVCM